VDATEPVLTLLDPRLQDASCLPHGLVDRPAWLYSPNRVRRPRAMGVVLQLELAGKFMRLWFVKSVPRQPFTAPSHRQTTRDRHQAGGS
jgi:hypothetical protein